MKSAVKRRGGGSKKQKPPGNKSARLNITVPQALLDEGMKLVDKYHFTGISDLFQKLLRDAVFSPDGSAITLNDAPRKNTPEGN